MSTRLIARHRAVRSSGDAGVTLMEVLVGMTLASILGAMTLMLFTTINTSSANTTDRSIDTAYARAAIQSWAAYLRVADGSTPGVPDNRLEWITPTDMLLYTDLKNRSMASAGTITASTMVWLRLDSKRNLVEEQFPSNAAKGTAPTVCRILVRNVVTAQSLSPATGAPLFLPFDAQGNNMGSQDLGTAPTPSAGCVALPVTVPSQAKGQGSAAMSNLQNVYVINIDFVVRDTKNLHPIEFTSSAVLPNRGGTA